MTTKDESKLARTQIKLKRWTRKLKLAQTKVLDLKRKVKYYEKKLLESQGITSILKKSAQKKLQEFLLDEIEPTRRTTTTSPNALHAGKRQPGDI